MKITRQRGQCFGCGTWVWASDPNGVLLPLANCREGYLFCDNSQLAKITICLRCEEALMDGDEKKMLQCLEVFVKDFNGQADLKNPTRYENSKEHWYNKGIFIPVPWENVNNERSLQELEQAWAQFKGEKQSGRETAIFSQYLKGACDFYEYLAQRLRDG